MAQKLKTFRFSVSEGGSSFIAEIEAVNPGQARRLAEGRYPGCSFGGFNQVGGG